MPATSDAVLAEEERLATEVYDRLVRPTLRPKDDGKYLAIAFETGDFEIDADDYAAARRLLTRRPGARVWLMRTDGAAASRLRTLAAVVQTVVRPADGRATGLRFARATRPTLSTLGG